MARKPGITQCYVIGFRGEPTTKCIHATCKTTADTLLARYRSGEEYLMIGTRPVEKCTNPHPYCQTPRKTVTSQHRVFGSQDARANALARHARMLKQQHLD
ncbi:MAG: hypothetical protein AAB515_02740 [Patescibacteria group bacterium]